jgi:hypothetical protein
MDSVGFISAAGVDTASPLPPGFVGRADAPVLPPGWASIGVLTNVQVRNLQAQIAYDLSSWDIGKIGSQHELGRYQFSGRLLEDYGLLASDAYETYGNDCVNYRHCWTPIYINDGSNPYATYYYNVTSQEAFLTNQILQDHLCYQRLNDLHNQLLNIGAITTSDSADIVGGMVYVAWTLGVGTTATNNKPAGTGAYAWRYFNQGTGINSFNSGRYAVLSL